MLQIAHRAVTDRSDPGHDEMRRGAAAMTAMLAGIVPLGLVVGATAAEHSSQGAAFAATWALYGASAHLAFLDLTDSGAGALLTVATCLLINARLVVYSASMAGHWRGEGTRFKALAAATIVDPSFALGDARYREPGSPAARFNLRPNDIITGVNREPVASVPELTAALDQATPPVALRVEREGSTLFLLLR